MADKKFIPPPPVPDEESGFRPPPPVPDEPRANTSYKSDARKVPLIGAALGWMDENLVTPGFDQMMGGVKRMAHPFAEGSTPVRQVLGGASQATRGAARSMGAPFLAQGIAAAPIATALGIGTGGVASGAVNGVSRVAGASPEVSDFLGDAAGIGAGSAAAFGAKKISGLAPGRANQDAMTNLIPVIGKKITALRNIIDPPPQAPTPFRPSPATAQRMPFTPYDPSAELQPGTVLPRGRFTPPADQPIPTETAPVAPVPLRSKKGVVRPFGGPTDPGYSPAARAPSAKPLFGGAYPGQPEAPATITPFAPNKPNRAIGDRMRFGGPADPGYSSAPSRSPTSPPRPMPGAPGSRTIQHLGDPRLPGRLPEEPKLFDDFGRPIPRPNRWQ